MRELCSPGLNRIASECNAVQPTSFIVLLEQPGNPTSPNLILLKQLGNFRERHA